MTIKFAQDRVALAVRAIFSTAMGNFLTRSFLVMPLQPNLFVLLIA
ncbi:hypothetical protein L7E55_04980 [Pelotomaculum isophthalicicum JI]|uniref:Uncharacterized protein n=1 Tax=Pelotomaculum isophthalicicum JI TaxID=947010 RepID=A0A9X4H503_9FIRM|nr:hypothetical protein [Pelotomaculum isophthalicicum]MDF9407718.1 hypothetical protein [Pelotomaculum isophthalicicum JI]